MPLNNLGFALPTSKESQTSRQAAFKRSKCDGCFHRRAERTDPITRYKQLRNSQQEERS